MEELKKKYDYLNSALDRLCESVEDMEKAKKKINEKDSDYVEQEREYRKSRDSAIKRFEFTIELFWKYIKKYLSKIGGVEENLPKPVFRKACNANLIEVEDSEKFLKMIDDRNMSSHIYKEEVADRIAARIPGHYKIIKKYADKIRPKS